MDWVTPHRVAALYAFLRECPPFSRWGLPEADAVAFRTTARKDVQGMLCASAPEGPHTILVSTALNAHLTNVAAVVAHEMIHLGQRVRRTETHAQHNAEFRRIAKAVCLRYGWDLPAFVGGLDYTTEALARRKVAR